MWHAKNYCHFQEMRKCGANLLPFSSTKQCQIIHVRRLSIKHGSSKNSTAVLLLFLCKKINEKENEFDERENCRWCSDKNMETNSQQKIQKNIYVLYRATNNKMQIIHSQFVFRVAVDETWMMERTQTVASRRQM